MPQPASAEAMVESAENGGRAQARSEPRVSTPEIKFSKKSLKRAKQLVTLESSDENLEQLLSKTPIKSAYMLGDLDPAYAHGCTWLALDETPLDSVLLLYSALRVPTLLSEGDADTIEAIILGAWEQIPRRVYFQMSETHADVLADFVGLTNEHQCFEWDFQNENPPCERSEDVVMLTHRHRGHHGSVPTLPRQFL